MVPHVARATLGAAHTEELTSDRIQVVVWGWGDWKFWGRNRPPPGDRPHDDCFSPEPRAGEWCPTWPGQPWVLPTPRSSLVIASRWWCGAGETGNFGAEIDPHLGIGLTTTAFPQNHGQVNGAPR